MPMPHDHRSTSPAALEVAVLFGALSASEAAPARALLGRLGQMLTRLAHPR